MPWRAFVDELTPEGWHVIFTNDDSLDETTIRDAWDAEAKQKKDPTLKRYGRVWRIDRMAQLEALIADEIATRETTIVPGFVATVPVTDEPLLEAYSASYAKLKEAQRLLADGLVDQTVLDAATAEASAAGKAAGIF